MLGEADIYYGLSNITKESCSKLVDCVFQEMSFAEDNLIMDIGCGTGDNTRDVLLARIPQLKKIIAVDAAPKMIEFARMHVPSEKIEYHVADIEDESSLKQWEGSISKVFSTLCFHWVKNQKKGFHLMKNLLEPKGEAAFVFIISHSLWSCYPSIIKNVKWSQYLKDADHGIPDSHHLNLGAEYYRQLLEEIGFEVLFCVEDDRTNVYRDDDQMKGALTLFSVLPSYIPDEFKEEFISEFFSHVSEFNGRNSEGSPVIHFRVLTAHVKKN